MNFEFNLYYRAILFFILTLFTNKISAQVDTNASIKNAVQIVEKEAIYPGGKEALMKFLVNNLKFPKKALECEISGTVLVQFVVCEDGTVCNSKVTKGPDSLLNTEALRVVKLMPQWKPAENKNQKVSSYYSLPITFQLDFSEAKPKKRKRKKLE